jgi:hypothetical protein
MAHQDPALATHLDDFGRYAGQRDHVVFNPKRLHLTGAVEQSSRRAVDTDGLEQERLAIRTLRRHADAGAVLNA